MKYTISLGVRAIGIQMLKLSVKEKDILLKEDLDEDLDEIFMDWSEQKGYGYAYEMQCLGNNVDRFSLRVKDVNGKTVYYSENVKDILKNDKTYDKYDKPIKGFKFKGAKDGIYLTRVSIIKGCLFTGELEIDGKFDKSRLYIIRDENIDDELTGGYLYPCINIFYQLGNKPDMGKDNLKWIYDSDMGEQYWDTYLMRVENENEWENLKE